MNEIINTPQYNTSELRILKNVTLSINGVIRNNCSSFRTILSYFPVRDTYNGGMNKIMDYATRLIEDNTLLSEIQIFSEKNIPQTIINKYIQQKREIMSFNLKTKPKRHESPEKLGEYEIVTTYYIILPQLVAYIQNKNMKPHFLKKLKELFSKTTNTEENLDKYLENKAKYLLSIDLETDIKQQQEKYNKKHKIKEINIDTPSRKKSEEKNHLTILKDSTHKQLWLYKIEHNIPSLNDAVADLLDKRTRKVLTPEIFNEWKTEYEEGKNSYQDIADKWTEKLGIPINKVYVLRKVQGTIKKENRIIDKEIFQQWKKEHETDSYQTIADRWSTKLGKDIYSKYVERKIKAL